MNTPIALTKQFDNFIIDVWGILTDGHDLYSDGIDLLSHLRRHKKFSILVSNTPLLGHQLAIELDRIGIQKFLYDALVTAGDVTRDFILSDAFYKNHGSYYFHLYDTKHDLLENSRYIETNKIDEAGFILLTGYSDCNMTEIYQFALRHNVPILCANPDISINTLQGKTIYCAGKQAKEFENLSGKILYFGKPYPTIYQYAFSKMPIHNVERTVAIGDTLETDIKGANQQNIFSILVSRDALQRDQYIHPIKPKLIIKSLREIT